MKPIVSVIIPCYNCADTLKEAVVSCFTQGLTTTEFEIVMVDDGSVDATSTVMAAIAKEYPNVRLFAHPKNRGGGAARNTGIAQAQGEFIFCLDSDNFFTPQTLPLLLSTQKQHQCDGVAIEERRFFIGTNTKRYHSHFNHITDRSITIGDIFSPDNGGTVLDNFLFSKKAYVTAGGYPEHHGFDTQCFELRFLAHSHTVHVAKGAVFYHRQSAVGASYFDRVYKAGLFSRNFYLICEDIIHLLSYPVREIIMHFDVFSNTKLDTKNLKATLDTYYKQSPTTFFMPEHERFMTAKGRELFLQNIAESTAPADSFSRAIIKSKAQQYGEALTELQALVATGTTTKLVYYNALRAMVGLNPHTAPTTIETTVGSLLSELTPQPPKISRALQLYTFVRKFF